MDWAHTCHPQEREYKSASAVTLDIPLGLTYFGFLALNSVFAFDSSNYPGWLIWLAFLALFSGLLGFASHSVVLLAAYLRTYFEFQVQPFPGTCLPLQAWAVSWACLGILHGMPQTRSRTFGSVFLGIVTPPMLPCVCTVMPLSGVTQRTSTCLY